MNDIEHMKVLEQSTDIAERVARILISGLQHPEFGLGSPTVADVAKIIGKDASFVREGIEKGWLPIGICNIKNGTRNFYISPKKLWEVTGYVWKGKTKTA